MDRDYEGAKTAGYPMGGNLSGAMLGGANTTRQSEVQKELERLSQTIGGVEKVFGSLADRVSPILRPVPPDPTEKSVDPECSTPIGIAIMEMRRKLEKHIQFVNSVRDRLEI